MENKYQQITELKCGKQSYKMVSFDKLAKDFNLDRIPYSAKILLENCLRHNHENFVDDDDIIQLAKWNTDQETQQEIAFVPARVILQDFTGVPAIVDLAAMRDAIERLGGSAEKINPFNPVELVIDHSVMVDHFASSTAFEQNTAIEIERNRERYQFLKWGQSAFSNFKVVPPGRGIVHQVNLEYLARCVFSHQVAGEQWAYPDTLVGTDSHTTMINGLGILGWGVGGIEAEAAMLGQPVTMLIPKVVGFELTGKLQPGVTATDMVLTITEQLRQHGVVGKFVEFFGPGLKFLSTADRATIANMAPEYGATCGIFPLDQESIRYLELTGRSSEQIALVESYAKKLGIWHDDQSPTADYHENLTLDLGSIVPSIAGPKRPQDRIELTAAAKKFDEWLEQRIAIVDADKSDFAAEGGSATDSKATQQSHSSVPVTFRDKQFELSPGAIVIAAITSCTNTSNPSVLVAAGLLAKNAVAKGLSSKPWVKTSLAPGSQVVTEYLKDAGLLDDLEQLGFNLVGYGCTTCIGNSGPLPEPIENAIRVGRLPVCSVLSGNRNFEGRIHSDIAANYLASPPLVVAYALAGNMQCDLTKDPLGTDANGNPVYLKDIWPTDKEIRELVEKNVTETLFREKYADVFKGNQTWDQLNVADSSIYDWPESSYIQHPPFFQEMQADSEQVNDIVNARCLVKVGDSITTDHISPAGAIAQNSPAGEYLMSLGIDAKDFNSYGSRRGNHEVMMRGTFANVRLKNHLAPGTEGSHTTHFPSQEKMSIYDAAMKYQKENVPTLVIAGKEYGTGSSRDWAAKGPNLLGVKAVLAQSYERIHRSNLIGMGILPLQFKEGESADSLQLSGEEEFTIPAISAGQKTLDITIQQADSKTKTVTMDIRIDTENEFQYFANGGILHYVIRKLLNEK
ncbi:aconitate hydratase AcnA [Pleionea litopenaei]|uniref:Aconitate hydratase n=1 Tax=Pleionea litopenaei TaxID=3070815 RepID=A0AA51RTM3_9GAMM|nr:aconitate hydratase AcnA [Pleionea sp. HL-JVS1]WMS87360.1 aconitate hydratase AcnA [Pleionea sp. HL-JVS1]